MSDADKAAWLASLLGGSAPSLLAKPAAGISLFRAASVTDLPTSAGIFDAPRADGLRLRSVSTNDVPASAAAAAAALPPAPTLAEGGAKAHTLTLAWSWTPPPVDGEFACAVEYLEADYADAEPRAEPLRPPPARAQLRGLRANTAYVVRVVATPVSGAPPLASAQVRLWTAPLAPAEPEVVELAPTSARLCWDAPAEGAARYAVYGSAALNYLKCYAGTARECLVERLVPGVEYGFRVCALNSAGAASEFSAELALVTPVATATAAAEAAAARGSGAPVPVTVTPATPAADEAARGARGAAAAPSPAAAPPLAAELPTPRFVESDDCSVVVEWRAPARSAAAADRACVELRPDGGADSEATRQPPFSLAAGCARVGGLRPCARYQLRLVSASGGAAAGRLISVWTTPAAPGLPQLLHHRVRPDNLAMRWSEPAGGCASYRLDMREPAADDPEERAWAEIYAGETAGCEISYLTAGGTYHFRACALGEDDVTGPFTRVTAISTPRDEGGEASVALLDDDDDADADAADELGAADADTDGDEALRGRAADPAADGEDRTAGASATAAAASVPPAHERSAARAADGGGRPPAAAVKRPAPPQPPSQPPAQQPWQTPTAAAADGRRGSTAEPRFEAEAKPVDPAAERRAAARSSFALAQRGRADSPRAERPMTARAASPSAPQTPRGRASGARTARSERPASASGARTPARRDADAGAAARRGGGTPQTAAASKPARRPPLPPAATGRASQEGWAESAIGAKLHGLHANRMARIERLHAQREEAIRALAASPRRGSPRRVAPLEGGALSPREQRDRSRPMAAFASRTPARPPIERAQSPGRAPSPGPGAYEAASQFISDKQRLRRAPVGAASAFRSASPRVPSPRGDGRASGPGPGAYDPLRPGTARRRGKSSAAFGTLSPRFDSRLSPRNETPSPFHYSPRLPT